MDNYSVYKVNDDLVLAEGMIEAIKTFEKWAVCEVKSATLHCTIDWVQDDSLDRDE